jgi:lysophospholipase L1-like esterase
MRNPGDTRRSTAALVAAVVVVLGVAGYAITRTTHVAETGATPNYVLPTPTPTPAPTTLRPLTTNEVVIFGDSWTIGYGADDPTTQGWAPIVAKELGWSATIDGYSGSGYVTVANGGTLGQFVAAATFPAGYSPALVVMQGSVNDQGQSTDAVSAQFAAAVATVRHRFPAAQIVAVGPAAQLSTEVGRTSDLDYALAYSAAQTKVAFANPMTPAQWLPTDQLPTLINAAKLNHPSAAGYRQFATMFEAALRALTH